jgi:hypothetical protein
MKKVKYDEASVVRSLKKKSSIRISNNKVIEVEKDATDVGCGSWGKIDYLRKVHGYVCMFTKKITKVKNVETEYNSKTSKREKKFNMAIMTKNAMKKAKSI